MRPKTVGAEIVIEYIKKFPSTPNLTLARKIYKENVKVFKDVEAVRSFIRTYTGNSGNKKRASIKDKSLYVPAKPLNPFNLPESYANDYSSYEINQSKILIISDLHFPYQDNKSIESALNYGLEKKANCILINGDLIDFATISRHEKDWRMRSVNDEFNAVRQFLVSLRKAFPNAKIVFKHGNHDERWEKYLYVKAPELFDVSDFQLEVLLRLGELKIETVKDKRPIKIGKLTALHGHELAGGAGGVNPARSTFLKTLDNVIVGHYHKTSTNTETTMTGNVISVNSTGCLCGLNPLYMPINKHNLGFAYVELDIKTGNYNLQNLKVIKGKVY
jgi:predicted phosphodiesterase